MTASALDNKEVIVFANSVGTSSLFIWNEDGRYQRVKVNIVPGDTSRVAREVAAFLVGIPNAKASIVGDKVIVEGDNLSDGELSKIEKLAKLYPQVVNFTNQIGWEQMVLMDVKVVEFPKTELREIGLNWIATGGATIGAVANAIRFGDTPGLAANLQNAGVLPIIGSGPGGAVGLPSSLNILGGFNLGLAGRLTLLERNGKATILAEPQLSARSGSEANFIAGGEIPYSVSSINGATILFKPYGIRLDIAPRVDHTGVIRAKIETEVSSPDLSISPASGPGILTRRTKTEFNVRNGETMVISGLLQRNASNDIDKIPFIGDIPILGALFRSKRFQDQETELVVFVTPTVVDSRSPGLVDRVERTKERLQENLGRSPYLSEPLQPGSDAARGDLQPPAKYPVPAVPVTGINGMPGVAPTAEFISQPPVAVTQAASIRSTTSVPLVSANGNPFQAALPQGGSALRVNVNGLVLREEPDVGSRALMQLGRGAVVLPGSPQTAGTGRYRNVLVGELSGWVLANGVAPSLQPTVPAQDNSVLARPDQANSGQVLGPDTMGSTVNAGSVRAVSANNFKGEVQGPKSYRVVLKKLALRVTPDINALAMQTLNEGAIVEALPLAPSGYWIAVQADGKKGWIASQWLLPAAAANLIEVAP